MSGKITKRFRAIREDLENKNYSIQEAIQFLKDHSKVKYIEAIDVAVNLGIDAKKSEQVVRGSTVLPNGTGKSVRIAVFTQEGNAQAARDAGADIVGLDDLAEQIKQGFMDFDLVIASPDAMGVVGRLGPVLGPKGLMPNPKVGTVAVDVVGAIQKAKAGQVQYRNEKNGIIHCSIGKINFTIEQLKENLEALIRDLKKLKPSVSKGVFLKKITLSSTMGAGLVIDQSSLNV